MKVEPGTRAALAADVPVLLGLLNQQLGAGLYHAAAMAADTAAPGARVAIAEVDGLQVGGAVSRVLGNGAEAYYRRFGPGAAAAFAAPPAASIEALAVLPGNRRSGIGTALVEDAVAWSRDQGCGGVVAVSWVTGREGGSSGLFRRAGFRPGRTVPLFYLEESTRDGWTCPVCDGPCRCAAQFFHLPLSARDPTSP